MNKFLKLFKGNTPFYLIFFLVFIFMIFYFYYGIFHFNYAVPPGDDPIRHITEAENILDSGNYRVNPESLDPPIFHILLASLSSITGADPVSTAKYFTPWLAIMSVMAVYFMVMQFFRNRQLALLAVILYGLFSPQPQQIYNDGTYLNLISASLLLIFALSLLPNMIKNESKRINWNRTILLLVFSLSVLLTHSLSSIYLLAILAALAVYLPIFKWKDKIILRKNMLAYYLTILLFLPLTWEFYLRDTVSKLLSYFGINSLGDSYVLGESLQNISAVPKSGTYYWLLDYFLAILAIFGLIILFTFFQKKGYFEKLILMLWLTVLFIGSRSTFFQLPERFARDMAIIISILAAIFIYQIYKVDARKRIAISLILMLVFIPVLIKRTNEATAYNSLIRVQHSDIEAMEWIRNNTSDDSIILGMPRTIVAGDWGSYINLLTGREVIDATRCPDQGNLNCNFIYMPMSSNSMIFYQEEEIDYVYAGKIILGSFSNKAKIDWNYQQRLSEAAFLQEVAGFFENESLGTVRIYKINKDILQHELDKI